MLRKMFKALLIRKQYTILDPFQKSLIYMTASGNIKKVVES